MLNEQNGQPLCQALAQLSPNIFSHPIWVHFIETNTSFSPDLIQQLLDTAQHLQNADDLNSACQILLVCAVLQNRLGNNTAAITNAEQALTLAERHGLPHVARWAAWGASALHTHQGHYQQAAEYLQRLQIRLSEDNEWVLANIVEVARQTLLSPAHTDILNENISLSSLASSECGHNVAVKQLLHWGEHPLYTLHNGAAGNNLHDNHWPEGTTQIWQSLWCTIKRIAKGELRLAWVESNGFPTSLPISAVRSQMNPSPPISAISPASLPASTPKVQPQQRLSSPIPSSAPTDSPALLAPPLPNQTKVGPSLDIYCLGSFRVYQNNELVKKWPGHKAKAIFKYLMIHREYPINREILIDLFWDEVDPAAARKNLHQAIYTLRQILQKDCPEFAHILLEDGCYYLNPDLELWIDSEAFLEHYQIGQRYEREDRLLEAIAEYETAESLYQGEFLIEDRYEDWPIIQREELKHAHLDILDRLSRYHFGQNHLAMCIAFCQKILTGDNCREDVHRRLIRCYLSQGQYHLALRQYHLCIEALKQELDVPPMPATVELYDEIQKRRVQFSAA